MWLNNSSLTINTVLFVTFFRICTTPNIYFCKLHIINELESVLAYITPLPSVSK